MVTVSERAAAAVKPKALDRCPTCKQVMPAPRNLARHKLFFALLEPAMAQWPEGHEFQPLDTEHLRAWLLCEAGWCDATDMTVTGNTAQMVRALSAFMDAHVKDRVFFKATRRGLRAYKPRSISFKACREAEFKRILDDVAGIIEATIGVPVAALKREAAA